MTARDSVIDRVSGLYLGQMTTVKPFAIEELLARLCALFRRIDHNQKRRINPSSLLVKYRTWSSRRRPHCKRDNQVIDLTKREYELLPT